MLNFFPLYQKTPLHLAAGQGHIDVVKCLVDAEADISAKDMDGVTFIYIYIYPPSIKTSPYFSYYIVPMYIVVCNVFKGQVSGGWVTFK